MKQEDPSVTAAHRRPFDERFGAGKQLRDAVSRESLAECEIGDRDPIAIFDETNKGRLPSLVPIRRQRMSQSPFAFLRGAAALMAVDLARQPSPGIHVQACGDCHLMNFGAFLSPEGNALFDINDFDETLPDVDFTADLKRLAASFAVAALAAGDGDKSARRIAKNVALAYRERMAKLARLSPLEAWHSRINLTQEARGLFDDDLAKKLRLAAAQKHADREEDANFPHIARDPATGEWRIKDNPPLIYHVPEKEAPSIHVDIRAVFAGVVGTLAPEVATLLARYQLADSAFKVVGVGSVGTYCAIGLFETTDGDPLFLQIKEALPSALERLQVTPWQRPAGRAGRFRPAHHAGRDRSVPGLDDRSGVGPAVLCPPLEEPPARIDQRIAGDEGAAAICDAVRTHAGARPRALGRRRDDLGLHGPQRGLRGCDRLLRHALRRAKQKGFRGLRGGGGRREAGRRATVVLTSPRLPRRLWSNAWPA